MPVLLPRLIHTHSPTQFFLYALLCFRFTGHRRGSCVPSHACSCSGSSRLASPLSWPFVAGNRCFVSGVFRSRGAARSPAVASDMPTGLRSGQVRSGMSVNTTLLFTTNPLKRLSATPTGELNVHYRSVCRLYFPGALVFLVSYLFYLLGRPEVRRACVWHGTGVV